MADTPYDALSGTALASPAPDNSPTPLDPNAPPSPPPPPPPPPQPQLPPLQGQPVNLPQPQPQAPPAKPGSMWRNILAGALDGMAGAGRYGARSLGGGLGAGVAGYQDQQQQQFQNQQAQAANARANEAQTFASHEAAARVAYMVANSNRIDQLNSDHQQAVATLSQQQLENYKSLGVSPVLVTTDDSQDSTAAFAKAKQMYNGQIPPLVAVNVSGQHYIFDSNQIQQAKADKGLAVINDATFQATGKQNAYNAEQWNAMQPDQRAQKLDEAMQAQSFNPATALTPNGVNAAIAQTKNSLALFQFNAPKSDPRTDAILKQKQQQLDLLTSYKKSLSDDAEAASQRQADVKVAAINAKADATKNAPPKVENMLIGYQDGNPVAGTQQELQAAGATGISKMPSETASKTIAARELVSPDGLFGKISAEMQAIGPQNLGPAVGRWNEFLAGKVGTGPQFTELRNDLGLLSTKIMQAHVGSRGSVAMLDHFKAMADAGRMDYQTLAAALHGEYQYVHGVAMIPKQKTAPNGGK